MPSYGLKLREQVKTHGLANTLRITRQAVREKKIDLSQVSLRECAQRFMGDDWQNKLNEWTARNNGPADSAFHLREAVEGVDASAFAAITGQLLVDMTGDGYKQAASITDELFTTAPITNGNFGEQLVPYLSDIEQPPSNVQQAMPYPHVTFKGQYYALPGPTKYGAILNVTMEMIATDLTGQVGDVANKHGRRAKLDEEYRKLYVLLGLTNNYKFNGTTYNTYLTSGLYTNSLTNFSLADYNSVNTLDQLFAGMVDPVTGIPIDIEPSRLQMIVMPAAVMNARRIINATTVRVGNTAVTAGIQTEGTNPITSAFDINTSKHLRAIARSAVPFAGLKFSTAAGLDVFTNAARAESLVMYGDFKSTFLWREVYPLKITQAPPQHYADFEQDIPLRVKTSGFGVACVKDPRYVIRAFDNSL